jgi:molybdate transport system permease protein
MNGIAGALWLSLRIALIATGCVTVVTIPLAWWMARTRFVGKSVVEALITLPLVLPPTVVGYLILMALGARGWIGMWLNRWFGYSIVFRFEGAVLAAAVVGLPLLYMPTKAAFAGIEQEFEEVAKLFGAGRIQTFWYVSLPLARRGIVSGLILAFARGLGEFGATVMVFGIQEDRMTLPILVYADYFREHLAAATGAVIALGAISLGMMLIYNQAWRRGLE